MPDAEREPVPEPIKEFPDVWRDGRFFVDYSDDLP
jgi:hypothetical protein